jgi:hypothetical protein
VKSHEWGIFSSGLGIQFLFSDLITNHVSTGMNSVFVV